MKHEACPACGESGVLWLYDAQRCIHCGPRDCAHGSLARSCEICERDREIKALRTLMGGLSTAWALVSQNIIMSNEPDELEQLFEGVRTLGAVLGDAESWGLVGAIENKLKDTRELAFQYHRALKGEE